MNWHTWLYFLIGKIDRQAGHPFVIVVWIDPSLHNLVSLVNTLGLKHLCQSPISQ
ncbi:MAG: hypothetical protein FWH15_06125 [Betaproteobacteria bacterium]|nr:hypothetical protein [Betaproteobacteria bacterium]